MTGVLVLVLLAVSLVCSFYGVKLSVWTAALGTVLVLFGLSGNVPLTGLLITAAVVAIITVPLNVIAWRREFLSTPVLKQYLRMLPKLSDTEQVALDAGTVGWEGELFAGNPNWRTLNFTLHDRRE